MNRTTGTALIVLILALLGLWLWTSLIEAENPESDGETVTVPYSPRVEELNRPTTWQKARADLETLAVVTVDKSGYDRVPQFGPLWPNLDELGCNEREETLLRDMAETDGTRCKITTGTLHDPYNDKVIEFKRGKETSGAVQIDHVVALADAWGKGAKDISQAERKALATDPINLLAVDGPTNNDKRDKDSAQWLPANEEIWCAYITAQVQVKLKYELGVTSQEKRVNEQILDACTTGAPMPHMSQQAERQ